MAAAEYALQHAHHLQKRAIVLTLQPSRAWRSSRSWRGCSPWRPVWSYSVQLCHKRQSDVKHCTLVLCPFTTVVRIAKLLVPAIEASPKQNTALKLSFWLP